MFTCWKCNKELPDSTTTCPDCQSNVTQKVVDNMMTIGPGGGPTSQILPGVLIANRYEVMQEIGRGGMGIVYLARDTTMEQDVALKVIPQELCMDPKAVADLKRETAIALKLSHPHIMRLHTLDTWEGQAFVVMELVDGGTLAHLMADKGVFPLAEALVYLKQMADALDYSHRSIPAVVHRDLKPLNVLLNDQGEVKIADYGLARVLRDSASRISNQDSAGTLSYMAPEQVKGKGIGKAVDIYALAAIAYEMLSGNPPFYTGDLRWQIVHEEPEAIEGQPGHVNQALLTALSKDREDRPETAGELVALLAGTQEIGKRPKKKKKKKVKREVSGGKGKKRTGLMIGGLLLVALLAAGGWFLFGKELDFKSIFQSDPILTVSSDPSGATVYVDEGKVGETPVMIDDLPNGTHTVMLEKEKYTSHEEKIFVQKGKPINLNPSLVPEPFGDLQVTSDPSGAIIMVDDKEMGITPATLEHLDAGRRQIILKKEEYDPWNGKVEIVPLETAELNGGLVTSYGSLEITSTPSNAKVFIDGQEIGITPFSSDRIRKGNRRIELKLNDFDSWASEADVVLNNPVVLEADLVSSYGSFTITSIPLGADVYLDGKKVGQTPFVQEKVKKGQHQLKLKLKGCNNWEGKMEISAGKREQVKADLVFVTAWKEPLTGMEFVFVKGGCYQMGDTFGDGDSEEKPVHEVCVDDFWMGKYEVTQGEYSKIMENNPSKFTIGKRYPVERVSWNNSKMFADRLSARNDKTFRLPTEAEWEYAARSGGKKEKYSGSKSLDSVAWYAKNSGDSTHPVGTKSPNNLGLYDMSGNVWEWCADWYNEHFYSSSARNNPQESNSNSNRVFRGGSWISVAKYIRAAYRGRDVDASRRNSLGFRLVLSSDDAQ